MANGDLQETDRRQSGEDLLVLRAWIDSSAFILLYDIYYEKIFRYCLVRLRVRQITEDITSTVFLCASADIRRFKGRTRREFVAWLCKIADAQLKKYLRNNSLQHIDIEKVTNIDSGHKEKLKSKILSAYGTGKSKTGLNIFYCTAAVAVLVAVIILLNIASKKPQPPDTPQTIITPLVMKEIKAPLQPRLRQSPPPPRPVIEAKKPEIEPEIEEPEIIEIGGIVKNQESEPIEGASVKVIADGLTKIFKTDANGLWFWDDFVAQDVLNIELMATHPGYIMPERFQKTKVEQLDTLSFVTVLEKGITVIGNVVDWQQVPLQAAVTKGPFPKGPADSVICDANGWFRFNKADTGIEIFTIQRQGASPAVLPVEIKPGMEPIFVTLEQPHTIQSQVVDINEVPVEGADVSVSFWQGVGSLKFTAKTDADGFFQWDSAPPDEVLFDIVNKGFMSVRDYAMHSGIVHKILLLKAFRIRGKIYSSEPTEPVESFIATIGYYFEKDKITWQDANSVIFSGYEYEMNITEPVDFKLKIQSDGFEMAESPVFSSEQNLTEYDFVLKPEF